MTDHLHAVATTTTGRRSVRRNPGALPRPAARGGLRQSIRAGLHPVALAALVALHGAAWALPQEAKPTFGQTTVSRPDGNTLRIDQTSARAGIDWGSFSIGSGELVRVVQPGAQSVLVNRVTGLDPSVIMGRLQSNGRVFLTNPRGVIFGAGAQVDVGGLVATTLRLGDADMQAGAQTGLWRLTPVDGAGSVVNDGTLRADGTLALVAPQVVNRGSLSGTRVALGAVSAVQLDLDGDGLILLNARAADAARLEHSGSLTAAGATGGRAELLAAARGQAAGTVLNLRGAVRASGLRGVGGEIVIDGGPVGITAVSGSLDASSADGRGGDVLVQGQKLLLDGSARLDASGATGGGRLRVGGDWQGANPEVRNSEQLLVAPGAVLDASARVQGDGGRVVLWSDRVTRFGGQVLARGGAQGGDGGQAEVSGKETLDFRGRVDLGAARGAAGRLLLDPLDITIDDAFVDTILPSTPVGFSDEPNGSIPPTFAAVDVTALLATADVTLQARRDVNVTSAVGDGSSGNRLTLQAGRNLTVNAPIAARGVTLSANDPGGNATGSGRVVVTAPIDARSDTLVITNHNGSQPNLLGASLSGSRLDLTGTSQLTTNQTWSFSGIDTVVTGGLSGNGALTFAGNGTVVLGGSNSFSGGITVNTGSTLTLAGNNAAGGTGPIFVAGGARLNADGSALTNPVTLAAGATIGSGTSASAAFAGTVTLAGDATIDAPALGDVTINGSIVQTGSARSLTTQGTVNLGAATGYTGSTTVNGGTLTLAGSSQSSAFNISNGTLVAGSAGVLAATPTLTVNGSGQVQLTGEQTIGRLTDGGAPGGTVVLGGTLTLTSPTAASFGGTLTGTGDLAITGHALTLSGPNVFTGTVALAGGASLTLGGGQALPDATAVVLSTGTTLALSANKTIGSLQGSGGTVALGANTLTVGGSGTNSFGGDIQGVGGSFIKAGTGALSLGGSNGFTGSLTVAAGTLATQAANRLAGAPAVSVGSGATLTLAGSESVGALSGNGTVNLSAGTLTTTSATDSIFDGTLQGSGAWVKAGAGTLTLTGTAQPNGGTTLAAGTLRLGGPDRLGTTSPLVVDGGTLDLNGFGQQVSLLSLRGGTVANGTLSSNGQFDLQTGTVSAVLAGLATVDKTSTGTVTLSGANTYTSDTTVAAGTLVVTHNTGLGSNAGATTVADGATLVLNSVSTTEPVTFSGSGVGGQGAVVTNGTVNASALWRMAGDATLTTNGRLTLGGTLGSTGVGSRNLTKAGTGTLALGDGTWTGNTTVAAGTLEVSGGNALPDTALALAAGGTLSLLGDEAVGALSGSGSVLLGNRTLTVGTGGASSSFNGTIAGSGNLVKAGTGAFTLAGSSSATGSTQVSGGTLVLPGASSLATAASLAVDSGATLQLGGSQRVATASLQGAVSGSGTLRATTLQIGNAALAAPLVADTSAQVSGNATLGASLTTPLLDLQSGTLTLASPGLLQGSPALGLASGTTLHLAGSETVGSLGGLGSIDIGSGALTVAPTSTVHFAGQLSGNGGLRVAGTGTLSLEAANSYTGTTTVDAGTLQTTVADALPVGAVTIAAPGTLVLGTDQALSALQGFGNVQLASHTLTLGARNADAVYNGRLTGPGQVVKTGTGNHTQSGGLDSVTALTVASGTLTLGQPDILPATLALTVAAPATLVVSAGDDLGAMQVAGQLSGTGALSAASYALNGGTVGAGVALLAGPVTSSGSSTLNGTLSGNLTVASGTLTLGSGGRLGATGQLTVASGAALQLGGNEHVAAGDLRGTVGGVGTLTLDALLLSGGTYTTPLVADAVVASGVNAVDTTIDTRSLSVSSGSLTLNGTQRLLNLPALTVAGGASLSLGGSEAVASLAGAGSVVLGSGPFSVGNAADSVFSGTLTGSGTLVKTGTGALTLTGSNSPGATQVLAGTLALGNGGSSGSIGSGPILNNGVLRLDRADDISVQNLISGSGAVQVRGGGATTFLQANSYSGGTTITQGRARLASPTATLGSGPVGVSGGALLDLSDGAVLVNALNLNSGGVLNSTGSGSLTGSITLQADGTLAGGADGLLVQGPVQGNGTLTTHGTVQMTADSSNTGRTTVADGTLTLGNGGSTGRLGGPLTVNGTLRLNHADTVTVTTALDGNGSIVLDTPAGVVLAGTSAFTGNTVLNSGTLSLNGAAAQSGSGTLTLNGSTLDIANGASVGANIVSNGGTLANSAGLGTLTGSLTLQADSVLNSQGDGLTLAGTISGPGGFTKTGSGTVTLAGGNTFTGAATVAAGTLVAGHAVALGSTAQGTTVQPGAALQLAAVLAAEPLRLAGSGPAGAGALRGGASATYAATGPVTLLADTTVGGNLSLNGSLSDQTVPRNLTKVDAGTLTLSGNGSGHSGLTTVSAGRLNFGLANAIPNSTVVVDGGTLAIDDRDQQLAGLQLLRGIVTGSGGVLTSASPVDAREGGLDVLLGGTAGLVKTGAGTLALATSQTLAGTLTVAEGTVQLGPGGFGAAGVTLTGGSVTGLGGPLTSASAFDLRSGSISAELAGGAGLTKTGAGSVTLSGNNHYTGATTVAGGTLATAGNGILPDTSAVQVAPGATLAMGGNDTVASLALQGTLAGTGRLSAASYALDGGTVQANLGGGALTSSGNSTLAGQADVASVSVAGGRLALASAGRFTAAPTVALPAGSTLALGGDDTVGTLTGAGTVDLGSARLTLGSAADFSFDGQFSGSGGWAKQGSGTLTLTAAQTTTGTIDVLAGRLVLPTTERLPDTTALGIASGATLQLAQDETVGSVTLAGRVQGPGRLNASTTTLDGATVDTDLGAGTLLSRGDSRLNGRSAAGTVNVLSGTLTLGDAQRLADTAAVAVQASATLRLNGDQRSRTLDLSGTLTGTGTYTALGGYALNTGSRVEVPLGAGTLNVDGNSTLTQSAGATVVNVNAGTLTVSTSGDLANQAAVTVAPSATLAVNGAQTVGTLTLGGNVAGAGTLAVDSVVVSGNGASVQTTLQSAAPVTVASGTLTVGNGGTAGALVAPSTTVDSGGTLAFNRSDAVTVGSIGGSGTLRQAGSGTVQVAGDVSGLGTVQVASGNLALTGNGNQIGDSASVSVSSNATLTLGSSERVGAITLAGRLAGAGSTLNAGSYTLAGGTTEANLGAGTLTNQGGNSVIGGSAAVTSVNVAGGTLSVSGSQALVARPALDVQPGATLALAGSQTVGAVNNAGTLTTGTLLDATSLASPGAVQVGGRIATSGDQRYAGALTAVVPNPVLQAGGDIVALNAGNTFANATLAVQARSLQLYAGGAELRLGGLTLTAGDSAITSAGRLLLSGPASLAAGALTLDAQGAPADGAAVTGGNGQQALLPDPANGAASGTRLLVAGTTLGQTADGTLTTGADTRLRLRASGGGSIVLDNAGNRFGGTVSAVSGTAGQPFTLPTGLASLRLSRVSLNADALHLVADDGVPVAQAQAAGMAAPAAAATTGDAVRADLVKLRAATLTTDTGAPIRARLPYSVNQGPATSATGLVIDTGPAAAGGGVFGSTEHPLALAVGNSTLGIGGLLLNVLPEPADGGAAGQRLFLGCAGCDNLPVYRFGGDPLAAQAYFNGTAIGSKPLAGSVITTTTTLLENARRGLFENAVRTENVAPRLRAGVIAEVGTGRPATEGTGSARRPERCEGTGEGLDCAR